MISLRSIVIATLLIFLAFQVSTQQKLEVVEAGTSIKHQDLHLTPEAYQKFQSFDRSSPKSFDQTPKLHSFSLDRAVWRNNLEKVFDLDGNLIAVKGAIKGVRDLKSSEARIHSHIDHLKDLYNIKRVSDEIHIMSTESDDNGHTHTRVQQYVEGIAVYGGDMILHEDEDHEIYLIQGSPIQIDRDLSMTPKLSTTDIEGVAISLTPNYIPFPASIEGLMTHKQIEATLKLYTEGLQTSLIYQVDIYPNLGNKKTMLIDAHTGELIKEFDTLCKLHNHDHGVTTEPLVDKNEEEEFVGRAVSVSGDLFGEQRTINTYECNSGFFMVDASRDMFRGLETTCDNTDQLLNGVILTLDAGNRSPENRNFDYEVTSSNTLNNWNDPVAVSAHYNAGQAYEYFRNVFGRQSITGNGTNIISFINVTESDGSSMDNAYWNGEFIFYGNGNQAFNSPLARALDVAGHEMAHGVIQTTANLVYQDESGALNEHFADVFGTLIEREDFRIGEDISNPSIFPTGALRDMGNPNNGGTRLGDPGYQPDNVSDQFFGRDDNGGVHINSGIPNKAFFNFVTDESFGDSNGDRATIAEQIWYRALTSFLRSSSNFSDMRLAIVQVAQNDFGSTVAAAAERAFDAVGITASQATTAVEDFETNPGTEYVVWSNDRLDQINVSLGETANLLGAISTTSHISRPSATDDGQFVIFVTDANQIQAVEIDWSTGEIVDEFLVGSDPIYRNAVISKDATKIAAVTGDLSAGEFENSIIVFDLVNLVSREFELFNPTFSENNTSTTGVQYADVMEFDFTGENLIYDAFNVLDGVFDQISYWDIGIINVFDNETQQFGDGNIFKLFTGLPEEVSIGNPTFAKNSPNIIAFDFREIDPITDERTFNVLALDRETGDVTSIFENNVFGFPSYSLEDDQLIFNVVNNGDLILAITDVAADRITAVGDVFIFAEAADWGIFMGDGTRDFTTNTEETAAAAGLVIYPNPLEDEFVIDLTETDIRGGQLEIYDMSGRKILEQEIRDLTNISAVDWKPGQYLIKVQSEQEVLLKKVIKP